MTERWISVDGQTWHVDIRGNGMPFLMLHGFTGSLDSWTEVAEALAHHCQVIRLDFLGHGQSDAPTDPAAYEMAQTEVALLQIMKELGHHVFICLGYSMGGRVALSLAAHHAGHIAGLILESTSPGLRTKQERDERQESDARLAQRILDIGVESFVQEWERVPLFATQASLSKESQSRQRHIRSSQRAVGLAGSLKGLGTGSQPSVWEDLSQVRMPTLVLTGEKDTKFCGIANQMMEDLQNASHMVVPGAGHTIHLEQPDQYIGLVKQFLQSIDVNWR